MMKVTRSSRCVLTLAFLTHCSSLAFGQGGTNGVTQQNGAPETMQPSVTIAPADALSPNPIPEPSQGAVASSLSASRSGVSFGGPQAPIGTSFEVNAIQSYVRGLEGQMQPPSSADAAGSLFSAGGSNASLFSSNPTLQTALGQARYDLTNANERAAIAARAQYNRMNTRSAYDVTHSARAITSPVHTFQTTRNERTGIHIRMMDSLPGP